MLEAQTGQNPNQQVSDSVFASLYLPLSSFKCWKFLLSAGMHHDMGHVEMIICKKIFERSPGDSRICE